MFMISKYSRQSDIFIDKKRGYIKPILNHRQKESVIKLLDVDYIRVHLNYLMLFFFKYATIIFIIIIK